MPQSVQVYKSSKRCCWSFDRFYCFIKLLSVRYETRVSSLLLSYFLLSAHPPWWYSCSTTTPVVSRLIMTPFPFHRQLFLASVRGTYSITIFRYNDSSLYYGTIGSRPIDTLIYNIYTHIHVYNQHLDLLTQHGTLFLQHWYSVNI